MKTISIYIGLRTIPRSYYNYNYKRWFSVSGPNDLKCKNETFTGFKCVTQTIYGPFKSGDELKFLILNRENNRYNTLKLYQNGNGKDTIECKNDKSGYRNVYVYFYDKDPRPLLFCFDGKAYIPFDKNEYFKEWFHDSNVEKCDLSETGDDAQKDSLLEPLVWVVGFLNQVDLSKHPPGTNRGECAGTTTSEGITCTVTAENNSSNMCTYVIHTYEGKPVKVKVTCEPVKPSSNGSCYKKLTHEPAGMNGNKNGSKFRLGNIVYYGNDGREKGSIEYYTGNGDANKSSHWQKPLVKVNAYFYNHDTDYKDPLLVELVFANGADAETDKECYKLTSSGTVMTWQKDESAKDQMCSDKIVKYLDEIRYGLKNVLQIKLDQNKAGNYPLRGRDAKPSEMNVFGPIPGAGGTGKQVGVEECKNCSQLTQNNYKCFRHKISSIESFDYNKIAGVAFTIPGKNSNPIEIKLHKNGATKDTEGKCEPIQLTYNRCMGDVYVYFYSKGSDSTKADTVPLMLHFNSKWYKPERRDDYFSKWVQVPNINGQEPLCGGGDGGEKLVKELNDVNKALNQIDLYKSGTAIRVGSGDTGYGLPDKGTGSGGIRVTVNKSQFSIERVTLTRQIGPKGAETMAYYRVVHRTVNGFTIGDIKYKGNNFATEGIMFNYTSGGTVTIKVKNGGHNSLVTANKCNTVVAYYSKSDQSFQFPQLIVILKTDKPIKDGGTVTGSADYGYYILSTKDGGAAVNDVNYEYVWRPVTVPKTPVTLDDATDFRLLNSIVILLDQRPKNGTPGNNKYGDSQIGKAIKTAKLKSPGREDGTINRLKGKEITLKDETGGTCLKETGFKIFTHDITKLVALQPEIEGLVGTTLIAGLRFLIPKRYSKEEYRQLRLYDSSSGYSYLYCQNPKKVYVYFYQGVDVDEGKGDPRPLMFCHAGNTYRLTNMSSYFYWWVKDIYIKNCECKGTESDCCKLLESLVKVSNFLNRVDISIVPRGNCSFCFYQVHEFKGQNIKIRVEFTKAKEGFCYNKYTHTHHGTGSGGTGFRLGTIYYGYNCIKDISENNTNNGRGGKDGTCITSVLKGDPPDKYKSADKVVVFYYQGDTALERPLLVALCQNSSDNCTVYYELQKDDGTSSGVKRYKKGESTPISLSDTSSTGKLARKLDNIRSEIRYHLQIIIDRRPVIQQYNPDEASKCDQFDAYNTQEGAIKCSIKRNYDVINFGNKPPTYHLPTKTCYKAQFYDNGQVSSGTTETSIIVKEQQCEELELHGYRCYVHDIVNAKDIYKIGWLRFYLWDNTSGTNCGTNTTSSGASCPSPAGTDTCRELCLYKESSSDSPPGTQVSCPATANSESTQTSCTTAPAKSNCTNPAAPGTSSQLTPVITSYTTCKGNVYVFFYGEDPRPLMLCFAGEAYGPKCMAEYECRWVCVVA